MFSTKVPHGPTARWDTLRGSRTVNKWITDIFSAREMTDQRPERGLSQWPRITCELLAVSKSILEKCNVKRKKLQI